MLRFTIFNLFYNRLIFFVQKGWVELSAQKFMPRVYEHVPRLNVVSARTAYQDIYPNLPNMVCNFFLKHNIFNIFNFTIFLFCFKTISYN